MKILFENCKVFDSVSRVFKSRSILVSDGIILDIIRNNDHSHSVDSTIDCEGRQVIPGLVDIHACGIAGVDFNTADIDEMCAMARAYSDHGVTSVFPTLTLADQDSISSQAELINGLLGNTDGAEFHGVLQPPEIEILLSSLEASGFCELICDGLRVPPEKVSLIYRKIGMDRLVLVSNHIESAALPEDDCGSYLINGVENLAEFANIPIEDALICATLTPARAVGLDHMIGKLAVGNRADFIIGSVSGKRIEIDQVFVGGEEVY